MTMRVTINTIVINQLFTRTANHIPNGDAFQIHQEIPKFQSKKLRKKKAVVCFDFFDG
jgi:hypothetical protein